MIGKQDKKGCARVVPSLSRKRHGFTLIEVLVSTAIFLIIFVIIADLAILFNKNPQQVIRQKQVENDLDYAMEFLSQKIRTNTIDYDTYGTDLAADNPTDALYLIDTDNNQTSFILESDRLIYYDNEYNDAYVTSEDIIIDTLNFYIYPTATPWGYGFTSNNQPRVTISIAAHHADDDAPIYLQTTISSRVYER